MGHVTGYWSQDFVGSTKCAYEVGPSLSTYSITGQVGQSLETVLNNAKLDLRSTCTVHGDITVPVIPAMCSTYDANKVGNQSVRVKWGTKSISVTITLTEAAHTTHTYDSGTVTKAATCTAEGVKTYTCTVCGATKTEAIPKTDHSYNSAGVCTLCGAVKPTTGQYPLTVSMTGTGSGSFLLFTDGDTITGDFPNYQVTAGTKLYLSPGMQRGMQLNTMILRTASGKTQILINNSTGTSLYTESATCTMPAEAATLEISLSPAASHSVNLSTTGSYASQGTLRLVGVSDPNHVVAHPDDFLTVQATAKEGYLVDTLRVYDVNGNTWDTVSGINKASYSYEFDMLPVNMYFSVSFKPDSNAQQPVVPPTSLPFTDVSGHWALDGITYAYQNNLFQGTSPTTFAPEDLMNRAMVVTVLARYAGIDTEGGSPWYAKARAWAMLEGISDGTDMNGSITREQLATILYRYVGTPATAGSLQSFPDAAKVSSYAKDAMVWAVSKGLITGDNGKLAPQNNATRAQVATIMMRFCKL